MAEPVVASNASNTLNDGTDLVITKPTGLAEGDLMVAFLSGNGTPTLAPPSGSWTAIGSAVTDGFSAHRSHRWWKIADSGDVAASNFTFTRNATGDLAGGIARITGHHATTPINVSTTGSTTTGTSQTSPAATTTENECLILRMMASDSAAMTITTAGVSNLWNVGVDAIRQAVGWEDQATTGDTGTETWTFSFSNQMTAITVAIQPAAGGDVTPPELSGAATNSGGTSITATLSESGCVADGGGTGGTGGFTLSGTSATVSGWSISGTTLTLTLSGTVIAGQTVTYTYARSGTTDDIKDASGNYLADFSDAAVTNNSTVDGTAPSLSSATGTATSDTTADLSVSTNEGNGTLYWVVTTSNTGPSAAQVKAGNDHTGSAAADSGSQAVSGTGVQNISGGATGLTAETTYYAHFMHEDAATNQSTVATSSSFETDPASEELAAGTASFVSSGPAGISVEATDATGGTAPYTYQWERNEDGGSFAELTGETALACDDDTATTPGVLYGYRCVYTDDVAAEVTSNTVTAQVYDGGPLTGGSSSVFQSSVIRGA